MNDCPRTPRGRPPFSPYRDASQGRRVARYFLSTSTMEGRRWISGINNSQEIALWPRIAKTVWPQRLRIVPLAADTGTETVEVVTPARIVPVLFSSMSVEGHNLLDGPILCGAPNADGLGPALSMALDAGDFASIAALLSGYFTTEQLGMLGASVDKALDQGASVKSVAAPGISLDIVCADIPPISTASPLFLRFTGLGADVHVFVTLECLVDTQHDPYTWDAPRWHGHRGGTL